MIVVRFKMRCKRGRTAEVVAALEAVIAPSREVDGAIDFDIGRDLADPDSFIATEVFSDRAALERQEALPEVRRVLGLLEESLAAEPEATIYEVSSATPWGT